MIIYSDKIDDVVKDKLTGFFVGWKKPLSSEKHYMLLKGSTYFIVAIDTKDNRTVGFVTALTDGINSSFIPLLEVLPEFQRKGIGTELMKRILEKLNDITNIDLTCDLPMQSFYKRFDMLKSHGMVIRKYLSD